MQKKDVIEFFDMCAPEWDADMIRNDEIINMYIPLLPNTIGTTTALLNLHRVPRQVIIDDDI